MPWSVEEGGRSWDAAGPRDLGEVSPRRWPGADMYVGFKGSLGYKKGDAPRLWAVIPVPRTAFVLILEAGRPS